MKGRGMPESNNDHLPPETGETVEATPVVVPGLRLTRLVDEAIRQQTERGQSVWPTLTSVDWADTLVYNNTRVRPVAVPMPQTPAPRLITTSVGAFPAVEANCSRCHDIPAVHVPGAIDRDLCRYCIADDLFACADCNRPEFRDDGLYVGHDRMICRDCNDTNYNFCDACDTRYHVDGNGCDCDREGRWIRDHFYPGCGCCCDGCCSRRIVRAPRAIQNYSYTPQLKFRGEGKLFLGAEIELVTSRPNDDARRALELLGDDLVYCKEDGSISQGFELCTHPMSYDWVMNEFPWDKWEEFVSVRMGADSSTGIHVHVSRTAFDTPSHDYRWLLFWHRNAEFIQKIARRRSNSYAQFDGGERKLIKAVAKREFPVCGKCDNCRYNASSRRRQGDYGSRYCENQLQKYAAVNLLHSDTYECRVFASTVNQTQIKAAFGLVAGTVEYTRKLRANDVLRNGAWDWQMFVDWAASQGDRYAPLISEVNRLSPRVAKKKPRKSTTRKYISPEAVV